MSSRPVEQNYFICTLGQATELNAKHPHAFETINQFLDAQNANIPGEPAVGFPLPVLHDTGGREWDYEILSYGDLHRGSVLFAELLRGNLEDKIHDFREDNSTVALLCPSSPLFLFAWLGLMRLGLSVLLIAPQCQPSAIVHLCKTCNSAILFYDESYEGLANDAAGKSGEGFTLTTVLLPFTSSVKELFAFVEQKQTEEIEVTSLRQVSQQDIAYLHHTSGTSTGLPKPIAQSHRAAVGVLPCFQDGGSKATFTSTPLYHGGIADCFRAWASGALIWLFPGKEVPITAENVLTSLSCAERAAEDGDNPPIKYFSSVPYVLQMLAGEIKGLEKLLNMEIVGVGGAALSQAAGDELVEKGVNLISRFGSAECGFLMSSHRHYTNDNEWQYLRSSSGSDALRFEDREDGLAELVIIPGWPHMAKHNREDGSFATADLFVPHPNIPQAWKYHSRADSQLTLITGKKFDPAPLEAVIATSPLVKDVLVFGNGQHYPGALLFRSKISADLADDDLLKRLWPTIEKLNGEGQGHTRLSITMLVAMPAEAPSLEKSSKGTILRGQAEKRFQAYIDNAYNGIVLDDPLTGGDEGGLMSDDHVPDFILQTIKKAVNKEDSIPEEADLFSQGVDSIACMQIRAVLQKRVMPAGSRALPLNVIYDCGTIKRLSRCLVNLRNGRMVVDEDEIHLMHQLVEEYGTFSDVVSAESPSMADFSEDNVSSKGQVVILTGATGALGAHILDQLRSDESVRKIVCLVRAANPEAAHARIDKSLLFRKKKPLQVPDFKVVCIVGKLGDSHLGLSERTYASLQSEATIIIHAAWAVNFSMRLRSFVNDHISGLRNLLDLAIHSHCRLPPRFVFCSSTASVLSPTLESPIAEVISHDATTASPLGYSRSKWVAEAICEQAYAQTRMKGRLEVARIGQLCGDTTNGVWNVTEAWPLMLSTVHVTNSLPDLEHEKLDWLPVDIAAQAVLQIAHGVEGEDTSEIPVYHLINENNKPTWMEMLVWMKTIYARPFDIVPPEKWVKQLENLSVDHTNHPAQKLLGLWENAYCTDSTREDNSGGNLEVRFVTDKTRKAAPVMLTVSPIDEQHFTRMWKWIEEEMVNMRMPDKGVREVSAGE
ncbi:hypothetical protein MMC17_003817 [Xylographa soralifera]|nr:hypothetical protein [Xylographa soralifera]